MILVNQNTPMHPAIDEYWAGLQPHLPHFAPDGQRAAIVIHRELAKGRPVGDAQLAAAPRCRHSTRLKSPKAGDVGNVTVTRTIEGRSVPAVYDVTFAFVVSAFEPTLTIRLPECCLFGRSACLTGSADSPEPTD